MAALGVHANDVVRPGVRGKFTEVADAESVQERLLELRCKFRLLILRFGLVSRWLRFRRPLRPSGGLRFGRRVWLGGGFLLRTCFRFRVTLRIFGALAFFDELLTFPDKRPGSLADRPLSIL